MKCHIIFTCFIVLLSFTKIVNCDRVLKRPSVLIGILARNKAHTLPYSLSFLENLDYPKDRIALW